MPSYVRARVALVTSGAKRSVSGAKDGDLVLAAIVRGVVDAGVRFGGVARGALLAQIGLVESELHDPDGLVPFEAYVRAWEVLASDPDNERLGLRLGELSSPAFLGALGYAMVHAPDGLAAIQLFRRYRQLVSDTLAPHIDFEDEHVVYHLVWPARVARIVHFADCAFVGMVALLRSLMELPADVPLLSEAWYQCPEPAGFDREAALGCRVRFAAYSSANELGKRVASPYEESTTIANGQVEIVRPGKPVRRFSLKRAPALAGFLESFSATLAGDAQRLARSYVLSSEGTDAQWQLRLEPRDAALARHVKRVVIDGHGRAPHCFEIEETGGDSSILLVDALADTPLPAAPQREALQQLCRRTP